jgi:hypothetical protein
VLELGFVAIAFLLKVKADRPITKYERHNIAQTSMDEKELSEFASEVVPPLLRLRGSRHASKLEGSEIILNAL